MDKETADQRLAPNIVDYTTSLVNAALGMVPCGSFLGELLGHTIPNQQVGRIAHYLKELNERLSRVEQHSLHAQLSDENFVDLVEESFRQASRSVSKERREFIANLVANSVNQKAISHAESKYLLRLLNEINDVEVIRLGYYLQRKWVSGTAQKTYKAKHAPAIEPIKVGLNLPEEAYDSKTLQESYDAHLSQLGLLQPEAYPQHYILTSLGEVLLRAVGIELIERRTP